MRRVEKKKNVLINKKQGVHQGGTNSGTQVRPSEEETSATADVTSKF